MSFPFDPPIVRLSVKPRSPERPRTAKGTRSRRPHNDAKVAEVRAMVEGTALNYLDIAARTGVAAASICRWKQDGGWVRPAHAPVATDTTGGARASHKLQARTLARRCRAIAERYVRELEDSPEIDLEGLHWALAMLKSARIEERRRRPDAPRPEPPPLPAVDPATTGKPPGHYSRRNRQHARLLGPARPD